MIWCVLITPNVVLHSHTKCHVQTVSSMNEALRARVRSIVQLATSTINSLALAYSDSTGEGGGATLCKLSREPERLTEARFLDGPAPGALGVEEGDDEDDEMKAPRSDDASDLDISEDGLKKEAE